MRAGRRNIKPGNEFNHLFKRPGKTDPYTVDVDVYGTLDQMASMVGRYKHQVDDFAYHLKEKMIGNWTKQVGPMISESHIKAASKHIWEFLFHHVQYKIDTPGVEQLRTPNRLWADRVTGVDCDCYSIFISCVLTQLNIKHSLRITAYDHQPNFQHVYVVVPIDGKKSVDKRENYIVIDPVLDQFNSEKGFTKKFDKIMIHQELNGFGTAYSAFPFGSEFSNVSGVNGLGSVASEMEESTRVHLQNTFNLLSINPEMYAQYFNVPVYMEQIAYVLENWDDPYARQYVLEELEEMEMAGEMAPISSEGVNGVDGFWDRFKTSGRSKTISVTSNARSKVQALRNRRKVQPKVVPGTKARGIIQKIPALKAIQQKIEPQTAAIKQKIARSGTSAAIASTSRQIQRNPKKSNQMTCICNPTLAGLYGTGLGGFWSKVKNGINKVKDKVKNTVSNVKDKVKNTVSNVKDKVKNVVDKVKEVGGNIIKNNPVSWGIRKGMIAALKNNLFKMSSRVAPALLSDSSARSAGYETLEFRALKKVLTTVERMFEKIGGSRVELHKAIQAGKSRFDNKYPTKQPSNQSASKYASARPKLQQSFAMNGLGSVAIAAAAAAAGPSIGLVAKITGFLKKINFKKLFSRVKNVAANIKSKIASNSDIPHELDIPKLPQMEPDRIPTSFDGDMPVLPPIPNNNIDPTGQLPVIDTQPPAEDTAADGLVDQPGEVKGDASGSGGGNTGKIILGAVAAGGVLFAASKMMKPKGKGVNGIEVEV
ncbi:MAG: hypothetical protein ACI8ZM_002478 [Crocinitomix sp.]|jgi:hypothetical protein